MTLSLPRLLAAGAALLAAQHALAQQTIINVPSVDQTKKGHVFYLHESQVRDWDDNSYWLTTNFFTYGVTERFELALTAYNIGTPVKPNQAVALGWKTAQPVLRGLHPKLEMTVGAGQMVPVNLRNGRVGVWSYGQFAARVPALQTRLMVGVSNGPAELFGKDTTHLIASYEQPLSALNARGKLGNVLKKVSLLGEFWSGTHEFGDFVPGINYHTKQLVIVVGYKLSNARGSSSDGLILEVGRTF